MPEEVNNQLLVIATRGEGANFVEREGSQFVVGDLGEKLPNMTWIQIRQASYDCCESRLAGIHDDEDSDIVTDTMFDTHKHQTSTSTTSRLGRLLLKLGENLH